MTDKWFLIESKDIVYVSHEDGEPFDTLDAKWTVHYSYADMESVGFSQAQINLANSIRENKKVVMFKGRKSGWSSLYKMLGGGAK